MRRSLTTPITATLLAATALAAGPLQDAGPQDGGPQDEGNSTQEAGPQDADETDDQADDQAGGVGVEAAALEAKAPALHPVGAWVAERCVALESTDPEAETAGEDLKAIGAALEGVRVVGLGEATHGTSEFFSFRHRLLRHLVREQGFRVLAFESHHSGSRLVNDYVQGGESTLEQALGGLGMMIWRVEEVASMLRWMREYNQSAQPADRVHFVGIDIQGVSRPIEAVLSYLERVDPERAAADGAFYAGLRDAEAAVWEGAQAAAGDALAERVASVDGCLADFTLKRGRYVARSSVAEYERVLADLRIVGQFARAFGGGRVDARDRYMADNVLAILADAPTAKVALLAHNAHVQRGELSYQPPGHFGAGEYLARDLGSAYYALGLVFGSGAFQALEMNAEGQWQFAAYEIGPPPPATVGWMFSSGGVGDAFLDLRRGALPESVQAWFDEPRGLRWAGGYGIPDNLAERWSVAGNVPRCDVRSEFDGLVYVAEVRRASPLP